MSHITVRGIPDDLDSELRSESRRKGTSLNKTVVELLKKATGRGESTRGRKRDLTTVAGKWSAEEAESFDKNIACFESLDEEIWK